MARRCVFCDSLGPLNKEHFIPDWISRLFKGSPVATVQVINRDGKQRLYPLPIFQQEVGTVCKKCNGGWMATLEKQVAPFLAPMLTESRPCVLDQARQKLLATWAVKTAMVFEQIHCGKRGIPPTEYHRLYRVQQPPNGYAAWVAHRREMRKGLNGPPERLAWFIAGAIPEVRVESARSADLGKRAFASGAILYRTTFMIAHVVFQVLISSLPLALKVEPQGTLLPQTALLIWPAQMKRQWPPPFSIEQIGGLTALHDAFKAKRG
jgi:hypothetical protein